MEGLAMAAGLVMAQGLTARGLLKYSLGNSLLNLLKVECRQLECRALLVQYQTFPA